MSYFVYIVRCADNTLYTGITIDPTRREYEHNTDNLRGAKYTRMRRPVTLVYQRLYASRSLACKEESRIKKLTRSAKDCLIDDLC